MNTSIPELYGLVLIGGKSRRMKQNKAEICYHEVAQWRYCYDLLTKHCAKTFLSGPQIAHSKEYQAVEFVYDIFAESFGPLTGIISAFKKHPDKAWLILACDMPFFAEEALSFLVQKRDWQKNATAFLSPRDALPEPLSTIYEPSCFLPMLKFWADDFLCPRKFLAKLELNSIPPMAPQWLDNANTPQELIKAQQMLLEEAR